MIDSVLLQEQGKIVGKKLSPRPSVVVEVSFESSGKMLGVAVTNAGTYTAGHVNPAGQWSAEGHGILTARTGGQATWTAQGKGRKSKAGIRWLGVVQYQSSDEVLASLNDMIIVFDYGIGADGAVRGKTWEWK